MIERENVATARDDVHGGRALTALFADGDGARSTARSLQNNHFSKVWLAVTVASSDAAESARGGRFSSERGDGRDLEGELIRHGVAAEQATAIVEQLPIGWAVLTVDGHNHPEYAAAIVEQSGGIIVAGEIFDDVTTAHAAAVPDSAPVTGGNTTVPRPAFTAVSGKGSEYLGYGEPERYARGKAIDPTQRELLATQRIDPAAATREADAAVADPNSSRADLQGLGEIEERFYERRAASPVASSAGIPDRTLAIPVFAQRVAVTRRPVRSLTDEIGNE